MSSEHDFAARRDALQARVNAAEAALAAASSTPSVRSALAAAQAQNAALRSALNACSASSPHQELTSLEGQAATLEHQIADIRALTTAVVDRLSIAEVLLRVGGINAAAEGCRVRNVDALQTAAVDRVATALGGWKPLVEQLDVRGFRNLVQGIHPDDVNDPVTEDGETLLHVLCRVAFRAGIDTLLELFPDIDVACKDNKGLTAIYYFVPHYHIGTLRALMNHKKAPRPLGISMAALVGNTTLYLSEFHILVTGVLLNANHFDIVNRKCTVRFDREPIAEMAYWPSGFSMEIVDNAEIHCSVGNCPPEIHPHGDVLVRKQRMAVELFVAAGVTTFDGTVPVDGPGAGEGVTETFIARAYRLLGWNDYFYLSKFSDQDFPVIQSPEFTAGGRFVLLTIDGACATVLRGSFSVKTKSGELAWEGSFCTAINPPQVALVPMFERLTQMASAATLAGTRPPAHARAVWEAMSKGPVAKGTCCYNAACFASLDSQGVDALELLKAAVAHGYKNHTLANTDADLAFLRSNHKTELEAILATMKA